ncbi:hypothetical protein THIOM_003732, partial [Candidatus Thiomargarita nelsonii]
MKAGQNRVGHPINVATGALDSTHEDISIPGKIDLVWERTYNTEFLSERLVTPLG